MLCHGSTGAGAMGWCQDKLLFPSWGGHAWGSPAPSPGGPSGQWVLSVPWPCWQWVLNSSRASPTRVPASVDSRGHILARAPCQPLAPACPVRHHLLSPHCCHPAAATRVPPAWSLPAPRSGDVGVGCLGPSGPSRSRSISDLLSQIQAAPCLGGTGWLGQESLQNVAQGGPSCLLDLAGVWHNTERCGTAGTSVWHGTAHTAAGTVPLSPPPALCWLEQSR